MKTVIGGRQSGKTTETIRLALDTGAAIICTNKLMKQYIIGRCKDVYGELAADTLNIFTVSEIVDNKAKDRQFSGFVMDEGGLVLETFIRHFTQADGFSVQFLTFDREISQK